MRKQQEEDRLQRRVQEEAVKFLWKQVSMTMIIRLILLTLSQLGDEKSLSSMCEVSELILVTFDILPNVTGLEMRDGNSWTSENLKWRSSIMLKLNILAN